MGRTNRELSSDNISLVAAGVAYYIFVAAIPALVAVVSIYGLVMDPKNVQSHFEYLSTMLPEGARQMEGQMLEIASSQKVAGWGAVLGILLALWGGSKATTALIQGTNMAYGVREERGFFKLTLISVGLTLAGVVFAVVALGLLAVLPAVLNLVGLGSTTKVLLSLIRWPLLVGVFVVVLAVLYRFAPYRQNPSWRWVTPGATAATLLWIVGSLLLSLYVSHLADYNKTYGSLGGIMVLLLWLWLSSYAVLAGAELNAKTEAYVAEERKGHEADADEHPERLAA